MDTQYFISGNYSRLVNPRFSRIGENMVFETDIHIDGDMIDRHQRLAVIPVLHYKDMRIELPLVLVNGKERHRAYKQRCANIGGTLSIQRAYRIYKAISAGKDLKCRYHQEIPYHDWMEHADLKIKEE